MVPVADQDLMQSLVKTNATIEAMAKPATVSRAGSAEQGDLWMPAMVPSACSLQQAATWLEQAQSEAACNSRTNWLTVVTITRTIAA